MTRSVDLPTYLKAGTHTNVNTHPESAPRKQHKTNRNTNTNRAHTDPQRDRKIHTDTYLRLWLMTASCNRARQHQDRARPSQTEPDTAHTYCTFFQLNIIRVNANAPQQTHTNNSPTAPHTCDDAQLTDTSQAQPHSGPIVRTTHVNDINVVHERR
jgi:hypothetical protein